MAETEQIINEGESTPTPFAPSFLSQVSHSGDMATPIVEPEKIDPEDLEGLFSMPFDSAAFITRMKEMELTPEELKKLCRIWAKPFAKLAAKYPSTFMVMAATTTMGIIVEKVIMYYLIQDARKREKAAMHQTADNSGEAKREENAR